MSIQWKNQNDLILNKENFNSFEEKILETNLEFKDSISKMMHLDSITYLPDDILCKLDRAAMSNSLETRVPFLDKSVVDFAWRIPVNIKIKNNIGKWPLREILSKYIPSKFIDRPKAGFSIPIGNWLRGSLKDWAENLLNEKRLIKEGNFSSEIIRNVWKEHLSGKLDHSNRLWSILMFQAWLEQQ
jgi:asparagine synthase (glutamine-hydrolysing)